MSKKPEKQKAPGGSAFGDNRGGDPTILEPIIPQTPAKRQQPNFAPTTTIRQWALRVDLCPECGDTHIIPAGFNPRPRFVASYVCPETGGEIAPVYEGAHCDMPETDWLHLWDWPAGLRLEDCACPSYDREGHLVGGAR